MRSTARRLNPMTRANEQDLAPLVQEDESARREHDRRVDEAIDEIFRKHARIFTALAE